MAPVVPRLLLLAVGAASLRRNATDEANATEAGRRVGKRHRTGQEVARSPSGRSYVYIAGVPGTGQEYWKGALRRCTTAKRCQPREFGFYTGLFFGSESLVNQSWVKRDAQHADRIVPMNLVSPDLDRRADDIFYRAFGKRLTGMEDPRLPLYNKLARSNGDSLKVVVLTRDSAKELLAYNMKKFKLDEKAAEDRVAEGLRSLADQVRELPAESYRCMSFEDTLNLGENLEPLVKLNGVGAKTFALTNRLKASKEKSGCGFSGEGLTTAWGCPEKSVSASKVRAALDALEELCDPEDVVYTKSRHGHEASASSGKKIQWLVE